MGLLWKKIVWVRGSGGPLILCMLTMQSDPRAGTLQLSLANFLGYFSMYTGTSRGSCRILVRGGSGEGAKPPPHFGGRGDPTVPPAIFIALVIW